MWLGPLHENQADDPDFVSEVHCADCDRQIVMEDYDELAVCDDCFEAREEDERVLHERAAEAGAQSGALHVARERGDFDPPRLTLYEMLREMRPNR